METSLDPPTYIFHNEFIDVAFSVCTVLDFTDLSRVGARGYPNV
jgi:hypothetical protein